MQRRPGHFNSKRKMRSREDAKTLGVDVLENKVAYTGNPEHKRNPGDFGLTPPAGQRPAKSLCDTVQIFSRQEALEFLKAGLRKGMVSDQVRGDWPQNIWAVTKDGIPLEAQLENRAMGTYHGYPMPESDPFSNEVVKEWQARDE
ncbi:hypothetical protein JXA80_08435 [bacterium]|nr:hypothetical protein [candidate division CSSED10-310 bacterium]